MKKSGNIIFESLAAVVVIVGCFSIPSLLKLPIWCLPPTLIPVTLYMNWRLREPLLGLCECLAYVIGSTVLLFFAEKLFAEGFGIFLVIGLVMVIFGWSTPGLKRKSHSH